MSFIGKTYMFDADSEQADHFIKNSFSGVHLKDGDLIKVVETEYQHCFGATTIELNGQIKVFDPNHPVSWCFFTEGQATYEGTPFIEVKEVKEVKNLNSLEKTLQERYDDWVVENIGVYELFCKFAIQAINSGKKKISHWLIVNRIRWEVEIETKSVCDQDKEFKISNDYIALLARDFIKDYPEHKDAFNLKQMKRA